MRHAPSAKAVEQGSAGSTHGGGGGGGGAGEGCGRAKDTQPGPGLSHALTLLPSQHPPSAPPHEGAAHHCHTRHVTSLQHAASHAACVVAGLRCWSKHCVPVKLVVNPAVSHVGRGAGKSPRWKRQEVSKEVRLREKANAAEREASKMKEECIPGARATS